MHLFKVDKPCLEEILDEITQRKNNTTLWKCQINKIAFWIKIIVLIMSIAVIVIGASVVASTEERYNWAIYILYRPIMLLDCFPFFIIDMIYRIIDFMIFIYLFTYWKRVKSNYYIQRYNDKTENESEDYKVKDDIMLNLHLTILSKDYIENFIAGVYNETGIKLSIINKSISNSMPFVDSFTFETLSEINDMCIVDENTVCDDLPQVDEAYIPQTNGEGNFISLYNEADGVNRIEFDSPRWKHQDQLPLIKPLGLNCLLLQKALSDPIQKITIPKCNENDCYSTLSEFISHTNSSSVVYSLYELASEIGFTNGDSERYDIVGAFNNLGNSQITYQEFNSCYPGLLYQCNGFVTRVKEFEKFNVHYVGDPSVLINKCTHIWDGKKVQAIVDTYVTEIKNRVIQKWYTEGYCVSLLCFSCVNTYVPHNVDLYNPYEKTEKFYQNYDNDSDEDIDNFRGKPKRNLITLVNSNYYSNPQTPIAPIENASIPEQSKNYSLAKRITLPKSKSDTILSKAKNDIKESIVLLGLTATQVRPKPEFQKYFERLYDGGVRLVYFSKTDQITAKNLLQKMGINTDWNCYITLKERSEHYNNKHLDNWYENAKLPFGIKEIKKHIENVDQVPLKVHCFIRSNPERINDMLDIMEDNLLTRCVIGSSYVISNETYFIKSELCIAIERDFDIYSYCDHVVPPRIELEVTKTILSYPATLSLTHNTQLTCLIPLLTLSRTVKQNVTLLLLYYFIIMSFNIISFLILSLTTIPISYFGIFILGISLISSIIMGTSILLHNTDPNLCYSILPEKNLHKKKLPLFENIKQNCIGYFVRSIASTIVFVILSNVIFLDSLPEDIKDDWNLFIYNEIDYDQNSVRKSLLEVEEFYILYSCIIEIVHAFCSMSQYQSIIDTKPWKNKYFYLSSIVVILIHLILGCILLLCFNHQYKIGLSMTYPWYVWVILVIYLFIIIIIDELCKRRDRVPYGSNQYFKRMVFRSKLGMYSPR